MPELPEVETTRRGIATHITDRVVTDVVVRDRRLRWPVPRDLRRSLVGSKVHDVGRRAKYLVVAVGKGHMLLHLGMSGSLRVLPRGTASGLHDHVDLEFDDELIVRYNDPRRFGSIHYTRRAPERHRLLESLGPEPLSDAFTGEYLYALSRGRRGAVKNFLMDQSVVVGVGNIYACEALYIAGIHPARPTGRVSQARYTTLVGAVRETLDRAIAAGGTTLRDFTGSDGNPGYFAIDLAVYGRENESCGGCGGPIRRRVIGQRSSFFCPVCQR